jgi:GlpG protein
MRLIGHLRSETSARKLGDFLYVQGIKNQIELEKETGWAVWVHDEDHVQKAKDILTSFQSNPDDTRFQSARVEAANRREKEEADDEVYRKKIINSRQVFKRWADYGLGPITMLLIVASIAVFFMARFGTDINSVRGLLISENFAQGGILENLAGLVEIRNGQLWRIVTPMLVHFHVLHILFNMLWLRDLGSMLEARQGTLLFTLLTLAIAAVSNIAQYAVTGSPRFGGMSGVVYGLRGYIWMRGKFDPGSGLYLHPTTVTMMLIWFFLCFTPLVPNIANTVHTVGLLMGMGWGYLSALRNR